MLIASWNNMKQIEWFNKKILGVTTDSFFLVILDQTPLFIKKLFKNFFVSVQILKFQHMMLYLYI